MSKIASNSGARYAHVLTAGRTGSTFITKLLEQHYPEIVVSQEREPSRILRILNNIATQCPSFISRPGLRLATNWFKSSREGWLQNTSNQGLLVEINPFIVDMGSRLSVVKPAALIHLVRHPVAWVRSSMGFGSYSWRRSLVPILPFTRDRPKFGYPEWAQWSEAERFAWRWVYRNSRIREFIASSSKPSLTIRYEDLFFEHGVKIELARRMVEHLGVDPERISETSINARRENPTLDEHRAASPALDSDSIMKICAAEARHYGFEP